MKSQRLGMETPEGMLNTLRLRGFERSQAKFVLFLLLPQNGADTHKLEMLKQLFARVVLEREAPILSRTSRIGPIPGCIT